VELGRGPRLAASDEQQSRRLAEVGRQLSGRVLHRLADDLEHALAKVTTGDLPGSPNVVRCRTHPRLDFDMPAPGLLFQKAVLVNNRGGNEKERIAQAHLLSVEVGTQVAEKGVDNDAHSTTLD